MLMPGERQVTIVAVHWDSSLPPAEAAKKCGAPIATMPIATMPIERDWENRR
jgi:hypothetical protein